MVPEEDFESSGNENLGIDSYTSGKAVYLWETRKSRRLTYVAAIIILAIFVGVVYYIKTNNVGPTPITFIGLSQIGLFKQSTAYNFISSYTLPSQYASTNIFNSSNSTCHLKGYLKWYLANNLTLTGVNNFSELDQNKPAAEYIFINSIDGSFLNNFTTIFNSNGGYCEAGIKKLIDNSTFSSSTFDFAGRQGYLLKFSNFTDAALIQTNNYYVGQRPNLAWYAAIVLYKNMLISVGVWGFADHMNQTMLVQLMNQTIQTFITQNPS